ncbi:hypothetical protein GGR51DRAFT_542181 [Nemania sp. FL0031]|nr:hypothetical protein GGR51DRAFT_542181 [Nemania sp. FL0031]
MNDEVGGKSEAKLLKAHRPNTITDDMALNEYEYVQIPPLINQPCRLNFTFCNPDTKHPQQWKPVGAWGANASAFGWIIMNYADCGMQFFAEDGTFYRELRFGGPIGVVKSPAWTPFGRPEGKPSDDKKRTQLDLIIDSLMDSESPGYMKALYRMITFTFREMKAADSSYAQYINTIVGRPLALVNIGMSLELAAAPLENESDGPQLLQKYTLLDDSTPESTNRQCSVPVQIGDTNRSYDGLLGFWKHTVEDNPPKVLAQRGGIDSETLLKTFDYSQLYTFWSDSENCPNIQEITPDTLKLASFYITPDEPVQDSAGFVPIDPEEQSLRRNIHIQAISALIDPFTAVHAFTSILPPQSITMPRWSIEAALSKMASFSHLGPVLVTSNVPNTQEVFKLDSEDDIRKTPTIGNIGLPVLDAAQWSWLQPYVDDKSDPEYPLGAASGGHRSSDTPTATPESGVQMSSGADPSAPKPPTSDKQPLAATPDHIPLALLPVDARPRFQSAPYLAVEGYLQLSEPLADSQSDVKPKIPFTPVTE